MKHRKGRVCAILVAMSFALAWAGTGRAESEGTEDKIAALKQALGAGLAALRKYEWIEATTLSLKGEQKSSKQNTCYYGADGALQKVPIDTGDAEAKGPRGIRGKIAANKKEDMADYLTEAVALIKQYVPPDPAKIQAVKDAGNAWINLVAENRQQFVFRDYLKPGDVLSVDLDLKAGKLLALNVSSYLTKPDDPVKLDVTMNTLADGALYAAETVLTGISQGIRVDIRNTGHRPLSQAH